jgi:hypothetical protein
MLSLTNAATDFRRLQVVHSACQEEDEKKEKGKRELLLQDVLLILSHTNKHHYGRQRAMITSYLSTGYNIFWS